MEEMRGYERYLAHIDAMMKRINRHLPRDRKSLITLLIQDDPHVEAVDGSKLFFKRRDLEKAAMLIMETQHESLKLPIIVMRSIKMGKGVYTVYGGEVEQLLVKKVLNLDLPTGNASERLCIYRPQVQELMRKLGTLIIIGFEAPGEEET